MESMKIMINTCSPTKTLAIPNIAKTITSVKHKLICPTVAKRSLSSLDSFIIFCIDAKIINNMQEIPSYGS